jgi:hypothetical protein
MCREYTGTAPVGLLLVAPALAWLVGEQPVVELPLLLLAGQYFDCLMLQSDPLIANCGGLSVYSVNLLLHRSLYHLYSCVDH